MVKLIHADNFFNPEDAQNLLNAVYALGDAFRPSDYGLEIPDFNMTVPDMDPVFSKIVGHEVTVDEKRSGIFRKPMMGVHFEGFDSPDEWCFIVALEPTTFNLYNHIESFGKINARNAMEGYKWNYKNMMEWDIYTNILLEPNQGVLFKPWLFHSLDNGVVQYYRLVGKK